MSSEIDREITVTYAGVTLGGSAPVTYHPTSTVEKWKLDLDYPIGRWSMNVIVTAASYSALATACGNLEAAFRTPRGDLLVTVGGETFVSWDHSDNTGFNARPSISKVGGDADVGLCREYKVSVEVDLPADLSGVNGRRDASIQATRQASGRYSVDISATYTALSSNTAWAQAQANFATFAATVTTIIDAAATWQEAGDPVIQFDDQNKLLTITGRYVVRLYNQSAGGKAHASLRATNLVITQAKVAPGDSVLDDIPERLSEYTVQWSGAVKSSVTTDLDSLWENTVKPFLVDEALTALGASGRGALVRGQPSIDRENNTMSATLTLLVQGSSDVVGQLYTRKVRRTEGTDVVEVPGGPYTGVTLEAAGVFLVDIIIQRKVVVGTASSGSSGGGSGGVDSRLLNGPGVPGKNPGGLFGGITNIAPFKIAPDVFGGGGGAASLKEVDPPSVPDGLEEVGQGMSWIYLGQDSDESPIEEGERPYSLFFRQETIVDHYRLIVAPTGAPPPRPSDDIGPGSGGGAGWDSTIERGG